jgi:lipoic acid synthetase
MTTHSTDASLRVAWLGSVPYRAAYTMQQLLRADQRHNYLMLLEHPHVFTMGVFADENHVLTDSATHDVEVIRTDRGGDVTYHGPGQLVGYPIVSVPPGLRSIPNYVHAIEQLVIDVLSELQLPGATRKQQYPGVWVNDWKICTIGVRVSRGRSMHGFALNIDPDLKMFESIVPCGIREFGVTSLRQEGLSVAIEDVADLVATHAARLWGPTLARFDALGKAERAPRDTTS